MDPSRIASSQSRGHAPRLHRVLEGYEFLVCETMAEARDALAVRREVYVDRGRYAIDVPDEYDERSWLLLARRRETAETVGSVRITPRWEGPLEMEEYLSLPESVGTEGIIEISRLAILPGHMGRTAMPAAAMGLFNLATHFLQTVGAKRLMICARRERVWGYEWLTFRRTEITVRYAKLGYAEHELLVADWRHGFEPFREHRLWDFFFSPAPPEVRVPRRVPALGLGSPGQVIPLNAGATGQQH